MTSSHLSVTSRGGASRPRWDRWPPWSTCRQGVRTDTFRPDPAARRSLRARYGLGDAPLLLSVSRLVTRKGQDSLIRAMPAIVRCVPQARLLIVGEGPDGRRLRELAAGCGVDGHVRFAGSVPWAELPAHYAAADVFAMPCRTRGSGLDVEGLGLVFLEASASGLPVIAGQSGGAPETVQPGRTGTVVDGRKITEVARAAVDLLGDPVRAGHLGRTRSGLGEPGLELGQLRGAPGRAAVRLTPARAVDALPNG